MGEATSNSFALFLPFFKIIKNEPCPEWEKRQLISTLHGQHMKEYSKAINSFPISHSQLLSLYIYIVYLDFFF